jgi:hypothetical protein
VVGTSGAIACLAGEVTAMARSRPERIDHDHQRRRAEIGDVREARRRIVGRGAVERRGGDDRCGVAQQ